MDRNLTIQDIQFVNASDIDLTKMLFDNNLFVINFLRKGDDSMCSYCRALKYMTAQTLRKVLMNPGEYKFIRITASEKKEEADVGDN